MGAIAEAPTVPSGAALSGSVPGSMMPLPLDTVSFTDPAITDKILVQQVFATHSRTGTETITARLVNCTDFLLQIEGRSHFLGADMAPVEQVSGWKRAFLPARAIGTYSETSTETEPVKHYLIELREGR